MPKVRVQATPRKEFPGWWALGKTGSFDLQGQVLEPAKHGKFFPNGQPCDLEVTEEELLELTSEPNKSYLVVVELPDDFAIEPPAASAPPAPPAA